MEGYLVEGDAFGFAMAVLISTRRPTTVETWVVTALQVILTTLFVTVDIFMLNTNPQRKHAIHNIQTNQTYKQNTIANFHFSYY